MNKNQLKKLETDPWSATAMSASPTIALDLPQKYLGQVKSLLRARVPHAEVWAYGSRVTGSGHAASDLDLVLRNPQNLNEETSALYTLMEAFTESNLPIRVDVIDWARNPASLTARSNGRMWWCRRMASGAEPKNTPPDLVIRTEHDDASFQLALLTC